MFVRFDKIDHMYEPANHVAMHAYCLNITSYDARHHIGILISPLSHPYRLNKAICRFRTCISYFSCC
jgi:hypothetical protein